MMTTQKGASYCIETANSRLIQCPLFRNPIVSLQEFFSKTTVSIIPPTVILLKTVKNSLRKRQTQKIRLDIFVLKTAHRIPNIMSVLFVV